MSAPKTSAGYPSAMLQALTTASTRGELVIPTDKPAAMRLQFQGLRGALRREGKSELADNVGFYIQKNPPAFIIRLREASPMAKDILSAINAPPVESASSAADAALDRILGGLSPSTEE